MNKPIGHVVVIIIAFESVVKQNMRFELVVVRITDVQQLLCHFSCMLIAIHPMRVVNISTLIAANTEKTEKKQIYLKMDLRSCVISLTVSCHIVAHK
jgi:hypothetical protein